MTDVPHNPGTLLREQRQRLGLSTAEVAQQLNLKPSVIEQLEQLTLDGSVAPTFLRGYLKLYARLLKLNEQQVLQQFEPHLQALTAPVAMHSFSHKTRRDAAENRFMLASYFLAVLLIGLSIVWFWQTHLIDNEPVLSVNTVADANTLTGRSQTFSKPSTQPAAAVPAESAVVTSDNTVGTSVDDDVNSTVKSTEVVVAAGAGTAAVSDNPVQAGTTADRSQETAAASVDDSGANPDVNPGVSTDTSKPAAEPVNVAPVAAVEPARATTSETTAASAGSDITPAVTQSTTQPTDLPTLQPATPATTQPATTQPDSSLGTAVAADQVQLQLSFNAQCWLEVTGADGKRLAYQMAAAGQQLQLNGVAPLKVVLGNPAAVQITRNGQPVDLSSYQPGRAARLTLTGSN